MFQMPRPKLFKTAINIAFSPFLRIATSTMYYVLSAYQLEFGTLTMCQQHSTNATETVSINRSQVQRSAEIISMSNSHDTHPFRDDKPELALKS
jgi:hypothetical protein